MLEEYRRLAGANEQRADLRIISPKLDAAELSSRVLRIAATRAAGSHEIFGSITKTAHPKRAAQDSLSAGRGRFTSSDRSIDSTSNSVFEMG